MPVFLPLFPHQLLPLLISTHTHAHTYASLNHTPSHIATLQLENTHSCPNMSPSPPIRPPCGSLHTSSPHFLITVPSSTPICPSQRPDGGILHPQRWRRGLDTDSSFSDNVTEMRHCRFHHVFYLNIWCLMVKLMLYYTIVQKFGVCKALSFMFLKEVSYAHQGCIYMIKNTVKAIML